MHSHITPPGNSSSSPLQRGQRMLVLGLIAERFMIAPPWLGCTWLHRTLVHAM
jgi:hypothetical protein